MLGVPQQATHEPAQKVALAVVAVVTHLCHMQVYVGRSGAGGCVSPHLEVDPPNMIFEWSDSGAQYQMT